MKRLVVVARWAVECSGDFREGFGSCQQARLTPPFSDDLYPDGQTITILCLWQHDCWVTGVIEDGAMCSGQRVVDILAVNVQR